MSTALALIIHDLKNSLGSLESELEVMINDPTPSAAQIAHLHCSELRRHFVQFLTLYSAESGKLAVLCEDESPLDLLQHLRRTWQIKSMPDRPQLKIEIKEEENVPPFWHFDRRLVQLALDAAIHNASKYAKSQITLAAMTRNSELVFQIKDDGVGTDEKNGDESNATGLGVALCDAVARAHHLKDRIGRTTLHRDEENRETIFEIQLP